VEIQPATNTPQIVGTTDASAAVLAGCLVVVARAKWSASNGNQVFDGLRLDYRHTLEATDDEKLRRYKIGHQACTLSAAEIVRRSMPDCRVHEGFGPEALASFMAPDGSYNFWGLSTEYLYRILVAGADRRANDRIVSRIAADALIWPVFVPSAAWTRQ
jgi:hypothetical protein